VANLTAGSQPAGWLESLEERYSKDLHSLGGGVSGWRFGIKKRPHCVWGKSEAPSQPTNLGSTQHPDGRGAAQTGACIVGVTPASEETAQPFFLIAMKKIEDPIVRGGTSESQIGSYGHRNSQKAKIQQH